MSIPTNLSDAIAGMRDGTIGIQQVKIGSVVVSALSSLRITRRKDVTRRPVQAGYSVQMGVIDVPDEIGMDIVLANPDYSPEGLVTAALTGSVSSLTETWKDKIDAIYAMFDSKQIVDFTTHEKGYPPIYVIDEIDPKYEADDDYEGWIGSIHLVQFGAQGGATAVDMANAKTSATAYVGSF